MLDFHAFHGAAVRRDERGDDVFAVQVIHEETAAGTQRPGDGFEYPGVLPVLVEIAEAGEEIDHEIEGGDAGRVPHVALNEGDVQPFFRGSAARPFKQLSGQVQAGYPVAPPGQFEAVPAIAATEVQHVARWRTVQFPEEEIDLAARFFVVAMRIHPQVVVTKGGFIPVGCRIAMRSHARLPGLLVLELTSFQYTTQRFRVNPRLPVRPVPRCFLLTTGTHTFSFRLLIHGRGGKRCSSAPTGANHGQ